MINHPFINHMMEMSQLKTTKLRKRDASKIPTLKIWDICYQSRFIFNQSSLHSWFHPKPQICLSQLKGGFSACSCPPAWHAVPARRVLTALRVYKCHYIDPWMSIKWNSCPSEQSTGFGIIVTLKPSFYCSIILYFHFKQLL